VQAVYKEKYRQKIFLMSRFGHRCCHILHSGMLFDAQNKAPLSAENWEYLDISGNSQEKRFIGESCLLLTSHCRQHQSLVE